MIAAYKENQMPSTQAIRIDVGIRCRVIARVGSHLYVTYSEGPAAGVSELVRDSIIRHP